MNKKNYTNLLDQLEEALTECWLIANCPFSDFSELNAVSDKVLGNVSVCNSERKNFSESESRRFDSLYDEATAACRKARRIAATW